jgi:hypothetical protein
VGKSALKAYEDAVEENDKNGAGFFRDFSDLVDALPDPPPDPPDGIDFSQGPS